MREAATALRLREGAAFQEVGCNVPDRDANTLREAVADAKHDRSGRRTGQAVLLDGLSKSFGDRRVLSKLDLAIPAGQLLAIVGRSGCGKSTLLRLIAGLERPSSGTISIGGAQVQSLQPNVRLLFQDARLLPWHRVLSNVGIARSEWLARDRGGGARRCRACRSGK